jgi:hypothetical protein
MLSCLARISPFEQRQLDRIAPLVLTGGRITLVALLLWHADIVMLVTISAVCFVLRSFDVYLTWTLLQVPKTLPCS